MQRYQHQMSYQLDNNEQSSIKPEPASRIGHVECACATHLNCNAGYSLTLLVIPQSSFFCLHRFQMKIFNFAALVATLLVAAGSADLTTVHNSDSTISCTLAGTYVNGTNVTTCDTIKISSLTVPAGVTLDLRKVKAGAKISFTGNTTFGTEVRQPLIMSVTCCGSDVILVCITVAVGRPTGLPVRKESASVW